MGRYRLPRHPRADSQAARALAQLSAEPLTADEVAAGAGLTREQASMALCRLVQWGLAVASGPRGSIHSGCTRGYRRA